MLLFFPIILVIIIGGVIAYIFVRAEESEVNEKMEENEFKKAK